MSDLFKKFQELKEYQNNFGMVGMGYVVDYHNASVKIEKQLQDARDLVRDLVKAAEFYGDEANWLFNQIAITKDCEDIIRPNKPVNPCGGKIARRTLKQNADKIKSLLGEE